MGVRTNNTMRVTTIENSSAVGIVDVVMTSDTSFTATQVSCLPESNCNLPDGFIVQGLKVW